MREKGRKTGKSEQFHEGSEKEGEKKSKEAKRQKVGGFFSLEK